MPEQDDRIRCRYCGSNNFAGTTTCWQCNRPLLISQKPTDPVAQQYSSPTPWDSKQPAPTYATHVDHSAADKAAIALGLLFPLVGYPVGIIFMMLDDPRKTQLGRMTLLWSTIGLVLTLVGSLILAAPLLAIGKQLLPTDSLSHMSLPSDGSN